MHNHPFNHMFYQLVREKKTFMKLASHCWKIRQQQKQSVVMRNFLSRKSLIYWFLTSVFFCWSNPVLACGDCFSGFERQSGSLCLCNLYITHNNADIYIWCKNFPPVGGSKAPYRLSFANSVDSKSALWQKLLF